jgi:hypothetical protein
MDFFYFLKFELSLLFEKLFVFTRWRAKSTSWYIYLFVTFLFFIIKQVAAIHISKMW